MKFTPTSLLSAVATVSAITGASAFGGASSGADTGAGSDGVRHWHRLADGSLLMHNFECEPDTTCLYEGQKVPEAPATDLAELEKVALARFNSLQSTLQGDELALLVEGARMAGYDPNTAILVPGRRLLQARGGGGQTYGGGGGNSAYCPVGSYWGGSGLYCINNNIYWCDYPGTYTSDMRTNCGNSGCVQSAPGTPDQCDNTGRPNGAYCYNNNDCMSHYCYFNTCTANNNGGGNNGGGAANIAYSFWGPYYDSAVQGQNDRILNYVPNEYQCSNACLNEQNFYCASFEYSAASQKCVLSRGTYPVLHTAYGWNLYIRKD